MARFVLPGSNPGLLLRGTIDIDARLKVHVPVGNGMYASVRSVSFHLDPQWCRRFGMKRPPAKGAEILVPSVIPVAGRWRVVSFREAFSHAAKTGQHLGIFDTPAHATAYGNRLHLQQAAGAR